MPATSRWRSRVSRSSTMSDDEPADGDGVGDHGCDADEPGGENDDEVATERR